MAESEPHDSIPKPIDIDDQAALDLGAEILGIVISKSLGMYLSIGSLLLVRIFHNRLEVWHADKGLGPVGKVANGLRAMKHPELGVTLLTRCIGLVEQDTVLEGLAKWRNLTPTHFFLAQKAKIPLAQQASLFDDVNAKQLSSREFEDVLDAMTCHHPEEPKPTKSGADAIFGSVELLRAELLKHDQLFLDLSDEGLDAGYVKAFHAEFERFMGNVEDLELLLPSLGATIPDDLLKELRERSAKRMEPYYPKPAEAGEKTAKTAGN